MNVAQLPLKGGKIGIEREMLRCNRDATLAQTPHPRTLGNAFTHPNITTDYGEALMEIVTDAQESPEAVYAQLCALHRYSAQNIGNERLWPASMPCLLPADPEKIEIGHYGSSNAARIKRLYRIGLAHRYGSPMQMMAGVHFNYSPKAELWQALAEQEGKRLDRAYIDARYMGMIRNLQRHAWLISYLFGASPAVDASFAPAHGVLDDFSPRTLGWAQATSLRMSRLGYRNKMSFKIRFNALDEYVNDLIDAVRTPAPAFASLGLKDAAGNYRQISANILQIANEYYTAARPKQLLYPGERPANALHARGIAYVELRTLDCNPYDPCGISLEQIRFLETFMLWALLTPAPSFRQSDYHEIDHNLLGIACCGRDRHFPLAERGRTRQTGQWADALLEQLLAIAARLDGDDNHGDYQRIIHELRDGNRGATPRLPQRVYEELREVAFIDWALALQTRNMQALHKPLEEATRCHLNALRDRSLAEFSRIENTPQEDFATFLAHYFDPLDRLR